MVSPAGTGTLVAGLADNKYFLGLRYAEWCTAAPTLESAVAAASMAQDEIGHARSLYPLLRDLIGASPESEPETRTAFTAIGPLSTAFNGWTDFVAANFIFDTAMSTLLGAARASASNDLASRARRILEEEQLHWLHAEGWVRRLARNGPGVRRALESSLNQIVPESLTWLDLAGENLVANGILDTGAEQLRSRLRTRVNAVLIPASLRPV